VGFKVSHCVRQIYLQYGPSSEYVYFKMDVSCVLKTELNSLDLVHERTIPTMRMPLVGEGSAGIILGFLDRSRYLFFQVAPQLYTHENMVVPGI
jgi:hypothetical protein